MSRDEPEPLPRVTLLQIQIAIKTVSLLQREAIIAGKLEIAAKLLDAGNLLYLLGTEMKRKDSP